MQHISKERAGALSDGVIAIAATILVLELKVPEDHSLSRSDIEAWGLLFLGWVVSFVMIAIIWLDNHRLISLAPVLTYSMMLLTFTQLAMVSLIPFASNLIMDQPDNLEPAMAFNLIMLINGVCSALGGMLIARDLRSHGEQTLGIKLGRRSLVQILLYALTALTALLSATLHHPFIGVGLWVFMPLLVWFWLDKVDGPMGATTHNSKAKQDS
jgi:uncharacterized membrane protein